MEKLTNPLFFAVAVLALIAFLQFGLYLALRRELDEVRKAFEAKLKARRETNDSVRSEMLRIREELGTLAPPVTSAVPIGQSMNLSRRNQVLRMHLRGDSPSRIAGVLKISRSEVDLMLKVHRTVIPPLTWSPVAAPADRRGAALLREIDGDSEQRAASPANY